MFYHEGHQNKGVSASRNLGIDQTESEWVAFLDADDTYLPNRFDCIVHAHQNTNEKSQEEVPDGFYGSTQIFVNKQEIKNDCTFEDKAIFGINLEAVGSKLLQILLKDLPWHTGAITIRRNLFKKTGYFDINKTIAEDCDLWYRLATIGNIVPYNLPEPISLYHRHSTNNYHYKVEHRLAVLKAMLDSWQWAESVHCPPERLQTYPSGVLDYAYRSIIAGQQAKRLDVVWSIFELMFAYRKYNFFLQFRVIRQYRILILRYIDNINLRLNSSELK